MDILTPLSKPLSRRRSMIVANGPVWPEYIYTIWTAFGPVHFYYNPGNRPARPWNDTRGAA